MATINWRGTQVAEKVVAASALAIDQTTAAAVNHAKQHHEFENITSTLEGSLQMRAAEVELAGGVVGLWGSFDVEYAIFQELMKGETMPEGGTRQQTGGHPFLRPAADAEYPSLRARIRANLEGIP